MVKLKITETSLNRRGISYWYRPAIDADHHAVAWVCAVARGVEADSAVRVERESVQGQAGRPTFTFNLKS
ncbi:MAG: hypothetical protein ACKOEV_03025 [Cytophagales bacterium]